MVAPHIKRALRKKRREEAEAAARAAEEELRNKASANFAEMSAKLAVENAQELPQPPKTKARKKTPARKAAQTEKEGK